MLTTGKYLLLLYDFSFSYIKVWYAIENSALNIE